jgi:hypothetical protein
MLPGSTRRLFDRRSVSSVFGRHGKAGSAIFRQDSHQVFGAIFNPIITQAFDMSSSNWTILTILFSKLTGLM